MDIHIFEQLQEEELITTDSLEAIKANEANRPVSVHWDLKTLIYVGIMLFTSGLGVFLYKNINTIGHATLVTLTGVLAIGCLLYCFKKAAPYTRGQSVSPNIWFDYVLLLGSLLMVAFFGYLQFQYHVFGMEWGLATFIPMLILFGLAYRFDHQGVLSLAITTLGAWMGVAIAPLQAIHSYNHMDENRVLNGIAVGALLHLLSWASVQTGIKVHFAALYRGIGIHVLYVALIAGLFYFEEGYVLWFFILAVVVTLYMVYAIRRSSLYLLVCSVLYGYVALSYMVMRLLFHDGYGEGTFYMGLIYFIASGIGLVMLLVHFNRELKSNNDNINDSINQSINDSRDGNLQ